MGLWKKVRKLLICEGGIYHHVSLRKEADAGVVAPNRAYGAVGGCVVNLSAGLGTPAKACRAKIRAQTRLLHLHQA